MDKILGKDYKCLNMVFEIAQITYNERSPPTYSRTAKPCIENVTKKKRAGDQLTKKTSKKKKVSASFDSEKVVEDEVYLGVDVDSQELYSQQAREDEVRMISLVFNSSGLTLPMLTSLGDYFQNLAFDENVSGGNLSLPQKNVGKDTLPSSPPIVNAAATVAIATAEVKIEEGEILVKAVQETAEPSSQRFVAETPLGTAGDVGATLHVASPPQIILQDTDLGGGPMKTDAPRVKAHKGKGTTTVTLDFDDSDDIFDEETKNVRASRLTESIIDVNTGEKVAYQLEKGVSMEEIFPDPSSQRETTVDVGKMKEVAQEPATPAEALETISDGVDPEAYKRCLEYYQAQVPDVEAELVGKSSLELADASVTMIYKNALLQRSLRKSLEEAAKNAALLEKSCLRRSNL
ncbi:uncharacterized protein [Miscanthus floridulus]|uniref:uncharacterized protein isoform X2 n=1 Tax=Miscanthus floridulus TaxID=154761 RepID=UPI003459CC65